jgi:hypothetical protein
MDYEPQSNYVMQPFSPNIHTHIHVPVHTLLVHVYISGEYIVILN